MLTHSRKIMYSLAPVLAFGVCSFFPQAAAQSAKEKKGETVTITGCVAKGESADEFAITQNGKICGGEYADVQVTSLKMISTSCP